VRISPALVVRGVVGARSSLLSRASDPFSRRRRQSARVVGVSASPGTVDMTGRPASSVPMAPRAGKVLFTKRFNEQ
jgi:hypothetical protein